MHFINPLISILSFLEEGNLLKIKNVLYIKIS
jgi:hypothetical protein